MNPAQNRLMPWLQAIAAMLILLLFCVLSVGPMFGLAAADGDMKETLKAIMLILTGFLFGSAVSSAKKDDANAALTAQLIAPGPPLGTVPTGKTDDPVSVVEVKS